jgi:hypothetical protein
MFKTLNKNKNINKETKKISKKTKNYKNKNKNKRFSKKNKKGGFWWYFNKKSQPGNNCDDLTVQISKLQNENIELKAKIKQITNLNEITKNTPYINKANLNTVPNLPKNNEQMEQIQNRGDYSNDPRLNNIMNTNYENSSE